MPPYLTEFFVFVFGLCIGSFLNVCIYRLPAEKSIVHPGSMCPDCQTPIRFYDNIPVLSYLILRGKCRHCRAAVSLRYPSVELLTGFFALCSYLRFEGWPQQVIYFTFIAVLLTVTFIDLDHQIIPNVITLPGIPIFFAAALALPALSWFDSFLGLLAGGGSLYIVATLYRMVTGVDGMGFGDIKLLALIGVVIGWKGVIFTVFMGSAVGTLAGLTVMAVGAKGGLKLKIPFGPFLSLGAIGYLFFGPELINWYLNLMRF